jgi:hypothetical protein
MEDPEETPLGSYNFQTSAFSKLQRFPVPVTTKWLGEFVCMAVLPAAKPSAITATMLD